MLFPVLVWAQQNAPRNPFTDPFFLIMGVFLLFFMIVILPSRRKEERERQSLIASTEKNDRVLTTSGIYGTIVSLSDKEDEVIVRVDDAVKLRMTRNSILRNLTREEKAKEAQANKNAGK